MSGKPIQVLVVENGGADADLLERQLCDAAAGQFRIKRVRPTETALDRLEHNQVDVILLHLSPEQAMGILPGVQQCAPSIPVVVLSEGDDESAAVEVVRRGAQDFLTRNKTDGHALAYGLRYAIERKRAEEALQKSEAFYHSLVESLPQNIFRKDLLGRFTFGNRRFCAAMGKSAEEVVGRTDYDFFPKPLADKYRADDRRVIETGKTLEMTEQYRTPDGQILHVQVIKTPVHSATGQLIGTQGSFWDITERVRSEEHLRRACADLAAKEATLLNTMEMLKSSHEELIQAQLQLIQAEKLESVGRLAAGVAHEVKNPLAVLLMGLQYLSEETGRDAKFDPEVLRAMRDAIHRADAIIRGLVDFSANRRLDATPQDMNAVIRRSLLLVKHELTGSHVAAVTELASELPPVLLDSTKIQQVFVNLFMNAIQAMPRGGVLTVRSYARLSGGPRTDVSRGAEPLSPAARVVVVEVEDTGGGVAPEKLSKVFDPFFTTKSAGRGTGLGLTVTRKIVDLHDAEITLCNREINPGERVGALVTVTFKAHRSDTHDNGQQARAEANSDR